MTKPSLSNRWSIFETEIQNEDGLLVKTTDKERRVTCVHVMNGSMADCLRILLQSCTASQFLANIQAGESLLIAFLHVWLWNWTTTHFCK